jgi:Flp pilus assembly protein TadD
MVSHDRLGDLATTAGDIDAAHNRYSAAFSVAERLVALAPDEATYQSDLARERDKLERLADLVDRQVASDG